MMILYPPQLAKISCNLWVTTRLEPQDMMGRIFRLNRLGLPLLQRQLNYENTAFANLAVDRDGSAHQANELLADGQAQSRTGPRLLPGLGLLEMPEQLLLLVGRNARSRVLDFDPETRYRPTRAVRQHAQDDAPVLGKLDGVAQDVNEDLTQLVDIGHDVF